MEIAHSTVDDGSFVNSIKHARSLAMILHAGQVDKAGKPYVAHLERVVRILISRWPEANEAEIQAAWLHDALEDTEATPESLLAAGISPDAVRIVQAVTRDQSKSYLDWVKELAASGDIGAVMVKLADNADNSDPGRVAALPGAADRVRERYAPARKILEEGLAALQQGEHSQG